MSELVDYHRRASEFFNSRVEAIKDDQWEAGTPCTEWSVRDLLNHIVNENLWTVPLLEGQTIEQVGNRFDGDVLGDDPKSAWARSTKEAQAAVQDEGALDRTVNVSWGQIPGHEYVGQLFLDHLIHGWDLSRGIGADDKLDPELVEAAYEIVKPQEEVWRASGAFGSSKPDVPAGADRQTELLAILGRKA